MRRLYLQVYLTLIAALLLFSTVLSLAWVVLGGDRDERRMLDATAALVGESLPRPGAPQPELQAVLHRLSQKFEADLTVRDAAGELVAAAGTPIEQPREADGSQWLRRRSGPGVALRLPDGRWLLARHIGQRHRGHWLLLLLLLAATVAVAAYPVVRRLTGRIERLQKRVDALGAGDLTSRVDVEGHDEVAGLAHSFNRAAARIEQLVQAQRSLLANASHELRSPITRLRVALELVGKSTDPSLRRRIEADIEELDQLVGEILLSSRLAATTAASVHVPVDLLGLAAEEAARCGVPVGGTAAVVDGDPRLLRRMVRNLIDNAHRHGVAPTVEVAPAADAPGQLVLRVDDHGAGVPEGERERIFEPFYRLPGHRESEDGGAGLGLALVRQIARHHGGEARCLARQGGGTRFEVTLPRGTGALTPAADAAPKP